MAYMIPPEEAFTLTYLLFPLVYTTYHLLTALFFSAFLTSLPLLATGFTVYSLFACGMSVAGMLGLHRRSAALLFAFSNHLYLDGVLSAAPRVLVLYLFHQFTGGVCPASSSDKPAYDAFSSYGKFKVALVKDGRHGGTGARIFSNLSGAGDWCSVGTHALDAAFVVSMVALCVAQWRAAGGMRKLAMVLEDRAIAAAEENAYLDEKMGLMYED